MKEIYLTKVEQTIFQGRVVFDRAEAISKLDQIKIDITNDALEGAISAADLDLLIDDDHTSGGCRCFAIDRKIGSIPGSYSAPDEVNRAFGALSLRGYRYVRPPAPFIGRKPTATSGFSGR